MKLIFNTQVCAESSKVQHPTDCSQNLTEDDRGNCINLVDGFLCFDLTEIKTKTSKKYNNAYARTAS